MACVLSCVRLCDQWTVVRQAPLSMVFSRQEYWSGLPSPPPGNLPDPGLLCLLPSQVDSFTESPRKSQMWGAMQNS